MQAGELDTAQQFYFKVRDFLGQNDFSQFDTTNEMRSAVNAGLRAVAVDIGVMGHDTVTVSSASTFLYTLNTNFMERGLAHLPYKVFVITNNTKKIRGLPRVDHTLFGMTDLGTSGDIYGPEIAGWDIAGDRFWIYPAKVGDKIYIEGPIEATPHDTSLSIEAVIPESDRYAVVYYAVSLLARSRPSERYQALADFYFGLYQNHVANRREQPALEAAQ